MANIATQKQVRIMVWCTTHSLSTALARSLSQFPASQCLLEMFGAAANFGPERRFPWTQLLHPELSFSYVKALYEQPWEGKSLVLGKELSYVMIGKRNMIPEGYQHVFLIRDPEKSISSLEKRIAHIATQHDRDFYLGLNQFENLYEMYMHVTESLGKSALVLDADDLISKPLVTLQRLFEAVGLPFTDVVLQWNKISGVPDNWTVNELQWKDHEKVGWFNAVSNSTGFTSPTTHSGTVEGANPSPHFKRMIADALPHYRALYNLRNIKP